MSEVQIMFQGGFVGQVKHSNEEFEIVVFKAAMHG